jgi:DNA-binding PadR family transcriptional regulator
MSENTHTTTTDPVGAEGALAPDGGELSRFQLEILFALAAEPDATDYGLGIKRDLESYYGEPVNHGRLYPNLNTLHEQGYIICGEGPDDRTNAYELTAAGQAVLDDLLALRRRLLDRSDEPIDSAGAAAPTPDGEGDGS